MPNRGTFTFKVFNGGEGVRWTVSGGSLLRNGVTIPPENLVNEFVEVVETMANIARREERERIVENIVRVLIGH